jgi:hypothetical protein
MTAREHMFNTLLDTGVDEAAVDCALRAMGDHRVTPTVRMADRKAA